MFQFVKAKRSAILAAAKQRAKLKNLPFELTWRDITPPNYCPILDVELRYNDKSRDNSPSIDRIDNKKGYTKENIIIVSHKANRIKSNATVEELGKIYTFYKELCQSDADSK